MHDFCFTIPYGIVLIVGGLIGFAKKGSLVSLAGGSGVGLLLILAGYLSLNAFKKKTNSYFALILEMGGLNEHAKNGSLVALGSGLGIGVLLILAGYLSHKTFQKRKNSYVALIVEFVTAFGLTYVMGQRYMETSKIMPAGIVAGISAFMAAFYVYKVATGGNKFPAKVE